MNTTTDNDDRIEAQSSTIVRTGMSALERLRADLQKAQPMPEGTVIRFESVGENGRWDAVVFVYAALFVNGRWYLTGDNSYFAKSYTHQGLMDVFASKGKAIQNIQLATEFESVVL